MVMSTKTGPTRAAAREASEANDPIVQLEADAAENQKRLDAARVAKGRAQRRGLIEALDLEQAKFKSTNDNNSKVLLARIEAAQKELQAAENAKVQYDKSGFARVVKYEEKAKPLRDALKQSAPTEIDQAVAALEARIKDALEGEVPNKESHDGLGNFCHVSNSASVRSFIGPARHAVGLLLDLKLKAVDSEDAKKKIAAILKALPVLNMNLVIEI